MLGQAGQPARRLRVGQQVPGVRLVDPLGAAVLFGQRQPDVDVGAERFGDLGPQVLTDRAARDPAEHLAHDEAEGGHVVALRGARLPPGLGGGQLFADVVPIRDLLPAHPGARPDHAGAVAHHHRQRDVLFARLSELGPVVGHRRLQVQLAAVGQLVHAGGRQALRAGQHRGQGVLLPGAGCGPRRPSRPTG